MKRIIAAIILSLPYLLAPGAGSQELKPTAVLSLYTGQAFVWQQGRLAEAELGQALQPGDSVRTGKGSLAEIGFADGTSIRLGEKTSLYIQRADSTDRSFKLFLGKLWTKVAKLSLKSQFTVETPTAVAGVRGTVFKVEIQPDSGTRVAVEEGLVEVSGPGRRGRMLRLAALRQSFMRKGLDPSESGFDPQKENRWERWSHKMFQELRRSVKSLVTGLEQAVKSQEKLRENAGALENKKPRACKLNSQGQEIERQAYQNRRKFKLILLRLERRLHQTMVLAARVESDSGQAGLSAQAGEIQTQVDALVQRYQAAEAGVLETVERLQTGSDKSPAVLGHDVEKILARLNALTAKTAAGLSALRGINSSCDLIEPKLAELLQNLIQIKELASAQPLLAKQQFFLARQSYLGLKTSYDGFDFPAMYQILPEARMTASEARLLAGSVPVEDLKYQEIKEIANDISLYSRQAGAARQKIMKIERQARLFERLMLELALMFKL
ncbi:FecR domain-containing protein [candidate division TA06 bacterium]|nr:FecR domain-containing protein [candidate division TA06 bacterium]